jgi:hypothetical protein
VPLPVAVTHSPVCALRKAYRDAVEETGVKLNCCAVLPVLHAASRMSQVDATASTQAAVALATIDVAPVPTRMAAAPARPSASPTDGVPCSVGVVSTSARCAAAPSLAPPQAVSRLAPARAAMRAVSRRTL